MYQLYFEFYALKCVRSSISISHESQLFKKIYQKSKKMQKTKKVVTNGGIFANSWSVYLDNKCSTPIEVSRYQTNRKINGKISKVPKIYYYCEKWRHHTCC